MGFHITQLRILPILQTELDGTGLYALPNPQHLKCPGSRGHSVNICWEPGRGKLRRVIRERCKFPSSTGLWLRAMSRLGRERLFGRWRVETVGSYISVQLRSCLGFCEHFSWPCFSLWQRCLGHSLASFSLFPLRFADRSPQSLKCFHQGSMDLMI